MKATFVNRAYANVYKYVMRDPEEEDRALKRLREAQRLILHKFTPRSGVCAAGSVMVEVGGWADEGPAGVIGVADQVEHPPGEPLGQQARRRRVSHRCATMVSSLAIGPA